MTVREAADRVLSYTDTGGCTGGCEPLAREVREEQAHRGKRGLEQWAWGGWGLAQSDLADERGTAH